MSKFRILRETAQYSQVPDLSTTACGGGSPLLTFLMDFHSSDNTSDTSFEADRDYKDYHWWLARSDDSGWEICLMSDES